MSSAIAAHALGHAFKRQGLLVRFFMIAFVALGLAGCKAQLSADLDQWQANEIVAALFDEGISSERVMVKGGRYVVNVEETQLTEAISVLSKKSLPKRARETVCTVFKTDSLVVSPGAERAKMICALQGQLSQTIASITGVIDAEVSLVLPDNDPLRQQLVPSRASVLIRHQSNVVMSELLPQVKQLVANGVAGLTYDNVAVTLDSVESQERPAAGERGAASYATFMGIGMHRDSIAQATWLIYGLILLVLLLGGALGYVLWNQRQRVYPLQTTSRAK